MERFLVIDLIKRAAATAVQSGAAVLVASGVSDDIADIGVWRAAGLAAAAGVISLAHRTAEAWLDHRAT